MCAVKKPSIPKNSAEDDKDLPILRNPILDGMLGNIAAQRNGRNGFRIDLLNPLAIPIGGAGSIGGGGSDFSGSGGSTGSSSSPSSGGSTSYDGVHISRPSSGRLPSQ